MTLSRLTNDGPDAPPLLIAHGLYGSARNWGVISKRLSQWRPVSAVDMRNHGQSPWHDSHSYEDLAEDLIAELPVGSDLLGHSMGGKAAMMAALTHPNHVRKLIVADIAPVTYTHSQLPMIEAMEAVDLGTISSRGDADEQLSSMVSDAGVRAFLLQSLDVRSQNWRLNLPVLRREMPKIIGFPKINSVYQGPTLFLSGAQSDYVLSEHREDIRSKFPNAIFAKIPGAGHWLHAEKPREFVAAVDAFLKA